MVAMLGQPRSVGRFLDRSAAAPYGTSEATGEKPIQGENKSETLYARLSDKALQQKIKDQIKPMNEKCQLAHEEIMIKLR